MKNPLEQCHTQVIAKSHYQGREPLINLEFNGNYIMILMKLRE